MTLNNIKSMKKERGFTIVELLIVIVIIAILAAITIVAYNGVQKKANTASAQSAANAVLKKIEASNAVNSKYPADTTVTNYTATLDADPTSKITGSGYSIAATVDDTNGKTAVKVAPCVTGGTTVGAKIFYRNFNAGNTTSFVSAGDTTGTCTDLT